MKNLFLVCSLLIGLTSTGYSLGPGTPDPVLKAKGLLKELNLSDVQTDKIAGIYKESAAKFEKIKAAEHGNSDKMLPEIALLRTATIKKIKAVLTPGQAIKYDKLLKEPGKSTTNGGWSDGWSSTGSE